MNKFNEVLYENKMKTRERKFNYLQLQRKQQKKEHKKEIIITIMFIVGLIVMIGLAMKLGQDFTNDCMQVHSKTYCENGLK